MTDRDSDGFLRNLFQGRTNETHKPDDKTEQAAADREAPQKDEQASDNGSTKKESGTFVRPDGSQPDGSQPDGPQPDGPQPDGPRAHGEKDDKPHRTRPLLEYADPTENAVPPSAAPKSYWHSTLVPDEPTQLEKYNAAIRFLCRDVPNKLKRMDQTHLAEVDTVQDIQKVSRHGFLLGAPATDETEIIVIGDLHGCYANARAVLRQTNALKRLNDKEDLYVVFIGDLFDRGNAVMHGLFPLVLQLAMEYPHRVFFIRGDHEHLVKTQEGDYLSAVTPADTLDFYKPLTMEIDGKQERVIQTSVWDHMIDLFEELPEMVLFSNGIAVSHAGIPWLGSLPKIEAPRHIVEPEEPDLKTRERLVYLNRLSIMWTDPGQSDHVNPGTLADPNLTVHSVFGQKDFVDFADRLGVDTLIRGHEHVEEGAVETYDGRIITVCSTGGTGRTSGRPNPQVNTRFADLYNKTPRFLRLKAGRRIAEEIDWEPMLEKIPIGTDPKTGEQRFFET